VKVWEVQKLLTFIAMFDNRTIDEGEKPGTTAKAWARLSWVGQVPYDLAEEAVTLFFSEPPRGSEVPYLDPRFLRQYVSVAKRNREIEAARVAARRGITRGPADPRPSDFQQQVEAARIEQEQRNAENRARLASMMGLKQP
jgi:hypothetical protein